MAENPGNYQRTKHTNIRYYYIHKKDKDGINVMKYLPTKNMIIDDLFKSLLLTQQYNILKDYDLKKEV